MTVSQKTLFYQLNTSQHISWVKFKCKIMVPEGNKLLRVLYDTQGPLLLNKASTYVVFLIVKCKEFSEF